MDHPPMTSTVDHIPETLVRFENDGISIVDATDRIGGTLMAMHSVVSWPHPLQCTAVCAEFDERKCCGRGR